MLCDESLQEPFSQTPCLHNAAKAVHLRHTIDLCKEKLPCLLKIDEYFGRTFSQIRSNPELRSLTPFSEKSLRLSQNQELPPTIGYCLLKVGLDVLKKQCACDFIPSISSDIKACWCPFLNTNIPRKLSILLRSNIVAVLPHETLQASDCFIIF